MKSIICLFLTMPLLLSQTFSYAGELYVKPDGSPTIIQPSDRLFIQPTSNSDEKYYCLAERADVVNNGDDENLSKYKLKIIQNKNDIISINTHNIFEITTKYNVLIESDNKADAPPIAVACFKEGLINSKKISTHQNTIVTIFPGAPVNVRFVTVPSDAPNTYYNPTCFNYNEAKNLEYSYSIYYEAQNTYNSTYFSGTKVISQPESQKVSYEKQGVFPRNAQYYIDMLIMNLDDRPHFMFCYLAKASS